VSDFSGLPPQRPPANWYPDPEVPGSLRYWDGQAWTEHRQRGNVAPGPAFGPAVVGASYYLQIMGQDSGPYTHLDLQRMAIARQITAPQMVRTSDSAWFPLSSVPGVFSDKDWTTALILSILVGGFGVDQFYLGNVGLGIGKLLTLGGCGIWALVDIIRIATNSVNDSMGRPLRK